LRHYELIVVLSPILSQEEAAGEWDRIKSLVHRNGGGDPYEERWGMRRLAYPIKKAGQTFLEGNYLLTRFSSDTVVPPELEAHLRLTESVLRYLLTKSGPPESTPPSPQMMQMTRAAEIRQQQAAAAQAAAAAAAQEAAQPAASAGEASVPEGTAAVAEQPAAGDQASADAPPGNDGSAEGPAEEDPATAQESQQDGG
jgi:small subunit ribosomal protein S6